MDPFDTLLIDLYGVIIKESKGNFIPYTYAHFSQKEHERLTRLFRDEKLFTKASNGEITSDDFLSQLGFNDPGFHMRMYLENHLSLDEEFCLFAEKASKKYGLVLLSNDVSEWSRHILAYYHLDSYFKDKIVSGDVKCRKPGEQIFQIALERTGKRPERCIFVDNSAANLNTAARLGIKPILFNRDKEKFDGPAVNSFRELELLLNI